MWGQLLLLNSATSPLFQYPAKQGPHKDVTERAAAGRIVSVCVFKGPSELHKAKVTYSAKNVHASCVMTATGRLSICGACVDLTR